MVRTIKLGKQDVTMTANAATPYRFRSVFHEDLYKILGGNVDVETMMDFTPKLGYVMMLQAIGPHAFRDVTIEDFFAWLEAFEPDELYTSEILDLYNGQMETTSTQKKSPAPPSGK